MVDQVYSYVGISPCGCIRAATVDNPEHAKYVRRDVAAFMRYGDTIERMEIERARIQFCMDKHPKKTGCPHTGACPHRKNLTQDSS